jgi:predicted GIY-YIG superfamily endonuclease
MIDVAENGNLSGFDVDEFKSLYVGITNNPVRRGKEHSRKEKKKIIYKKKRCQPKLNAHIYKNGWKSYDMVVLKTGMTREEACAIEIDTIAKYRTFELGLNSSPGGEGCGSGADHPRAQAVNLYNCKTGEIHSFLWMGAAAAFLGFDTDQGYRVSAVASSNCHHEQIQSIINEKWHQAHYAYDERSFEKNMQTPGKKRAETKRKAIWVFNMTTKKESWFPGTDIAAVELGVGEANIHDVLGKRCTHFNVPTGKDVSMFDAQHDPKTREWKTDVLSQHKASGLTREKTVVAYDENDKEVCRYDSATKAAEAEGIERSNISKCATHKPKHSYAGKKGGIKLRWEYADPKLRTFYDREFPRVSNPEASKRAKLDTHGL